MLRGKAASYMIVAYMLQNLTAVNLQRLRDIYATLVQHAEG